MLPETFKKPNQNCPEQSTALNESSSTSKHNIIIFRLRFPNRINPRFICSANYKTSLPSSKQGCKNTHDCNPCASDRHGSKHTGHDPPNSLAPIQQARPQLLPNISPTNPISQTIWSTTSTREMSRRTLRAFSTICRYPATNRPRQDAPCRPPPPPYKQKQHPHRVIPI
jgi:hypothetical protein